MDLRNGDLSTDEHPRVVRVTSGPFKGRLYVRTASGLQRVKGNDPTRYVERTDVHGRKVLVRDE